LREQVLFSQARVGGSGWSVEWIEDELELGADNLRNLAVEQAGGIGHERIWNLSPFRFISQFMYIENCFDKLHNSIYR
jgi:hypothetical protein